MANFNKVILLGNLTRDVELRFTQGGLAVAKLGMAVNRKAKGQDGEMRETTCFVDMTAFGKTAEVLEKYVKKGSQLFVEGRLEYSTWEAKDGGGKRSKLEVIIENFQFVGGRSDGQQSGSRSGGNREASAGAEGAAEAADFDDIPF
jgi:single-strand DNA-binding protein